jgi:hypothetical protein
MKYTLGGEEVRNVSHSFASMMGNLESTIQDVLPPGTVFNTSVDSTFTTINTTCLHCTPNITYVDGHNITNDVNGEIITTYIPAYNITEEICLNVTRPSNETHIVIGPLTQASTLSITQKILNSINLEVSFAANLSVGLDASFI